MSDKSDPNFQVDLEQLHDTIDGVRKEADGIAHSMSEIKHNTDRLSICWNSPSFATFDEMQKWFTRVANDLHVLLEEVIHRMQVSYDNYRQAEQINYQNMDVHIQP